MATTFLPFVMAVAMQGDGVADVRSEWPSELPRGFLVFVAPPDPDADAREAVNAIATLANERRLVLVVMPVGPRELSGPAEATMTRVLREIGQIEERTGTLSRRQIVGAREQGAFVAAALQSGQLAGFTRVGIVAATPVLVEKPSTKIPRVVIESSGSGPERSLLRELYEGLTRGRIASDVRYRETRGAGFDGERARDFLTWFWDGEDDVIAQPRVRPP